MAERYQDRPFPADDRYSRGGQAAPTQAETDPLAELARLIGQTDPFANQPRPSAPQPARAPDPSAYDEDAPPMPAWLKNRGRDTAFRPDTPQADPHYQPQPDPYYAAQPQSYRQEPGFAAATTQPADPGRYDDALYGQIEPSRDYIDPSQETGGYPDPQAYGYDGYDEPEQPKSRGGMMTIVAVLALAVVGTGGAFAYRTFMAAPRSGEPPIIKADPSPTKVVPPSAAESSKPIQDRLASGNGAEALISREEQPQDPSKYGTRVVLPPLAQNANPPTPSSVAPGNKPLAGPPSTGDEPRKIKTLAVRPDQADAAATPANRAAPRPTAPQPAATRSPPPPGRQRQCLDRQRPAVAVAAGDGSADPDGGDDPVGPAGEQRWLSGSGVVPAQRIRCAGLLSRAAGQVPLGAGLSLAADQARRSRRQGRLLPCHGRPVRLAGRSLAVLRQPENCRRAVRRPKKLTAVSLTPARSRG